MKTVFSCQPLPIVSQRLKKPPSRFSSRAKFDRRMGKRRHNAGRADALGSVATVVGSGERVVDKVLVDVLSSQLSALPLVLRDGFFVALLGAELLEVNDMVVDALAADGVDTRRVASLGAHSFDFTRLSCASR